MKIHCSYCNSLFDADKTQSKFIEASRKKGMSFIILECPNCYKNVSFNPLLNSIKLESKKNDLRCPISACAGFISFMEDEKPPFYGCSECGSIWYKQSNLNKDIKNIILKYPYRKAVYHKNGKDFEPFLEADPPNYEEEIQKEAVEHSKNFVRG